MSKRADFTILLARNGEVCRADFVARGLPELTSWSREEIASGVSLVDAVNAAVSERNRAGRTTIVLSPDIWNQLISLPRLSVVDADEGELKSALKFEAETFTGLDPEQTAIGEIQVDSNEDDQGFWINLVEKSTQEELNALLTRRGAKEVLLAHPFAMGAGEPTASQRVEIWGNQAASISSDGLLERVVQGPFESDRWLGELGLVEALEPADVQLTLEPQSILPLESNVFSEVEDLSDDASLQNWMSNVVKNVVSRREALPFIAVEKQKRTTNSGMLVAMVLLVSVLAFGFVHSRWINQQTLAAKAKAYQLRQPQEEKQLADNELALLLGKRTDLEEDAATVKEELRMVQFMFDRKTERVRILLDYLLECRTDDMVIREISHHEDGTELSGISLGGDSAPLFANRLRELVLALGWQIHPATQVGDRKMTSGGPWRFTILMEDIGPESITPVDTQTTVQVSPSVAKDPAWKGGTR